MADWLSHVVAASTLADGPSADGNIPTTGACGISTLDGVTLTNPSRILLKNQTSGATNGTYVWTSSTAALSASGDAPYNNQMVVRISDGATNTCAEYALRIDGLGNNIWNRQTLVFNVRDFGAKGDGITDDWAAITATIRAAGGVGITTVGTESSQVYFPKGFYRTSLPLILSRGTYFGDVGSLETASSQIQPDLGVSGIIVGRGIVAAEPFSPLTVYQQNQTVCASTEIDTSGITNSGGFVEVQTTAAHSLVISDNIRVYGSPGGTAFNTGGGNPSQWVVTNVIDATHFVTNAPFVATGGGGNVVNVSVQYIALNSTGLVAGATPFARVIDAQYTSTGGTRWLCYPSTDAEWCTVRDLAIQATGGTLAPNHSNGITVHATCELRNLGVYGFGRHGFEFASNQKTLAGQIYGTASDECLVTNCRSVGNGGNGYFIYGGDSNASTFVACHAQSNGGHSFRDGSFLGNNFFGCSDDTRNDDRFSAYTNLQPIPTGIAQVAGTSSGTASAIRVETVSAHGFFNNDVVELVGVTGVTPSGGKWTIAVVDATHFELPGTVWTSGGAGGTAEDLMGYPEGTCASKFVGCYTEGGGNNRIWRPALVLGLDGDWTVGPPLTGWDGISNPSATLYSAPNARRLDGASGSQNLSARDIVGPLELTTYLGVNDGLTTLGLAVSVENAYTGWVYSWPNSGTTGSPSLSGWGAADAGWWALAYNPGAYGGSSVAIAVSSAQNKFGLGQAYAPSGLMVSDFRGHAAAPGVHLKFTSCIDTSTGNHGVAPTSGLWQAGSYVANANAQPGDAVGWVATRSGGWAPSWTMNTSFLRGATMSLGGYVYRMRGYGDFWTQNTVYTTGDTVQANCEDVAFRLTTPPAYNGTAGTYLQNNWTYQKNAGAETTAGNYYQCVAAPSGVDPGQEPGTGGYPSWPATGQYIQCKSGSTPVVTSGPPFLSGYVVFVSLAPNTSGTTDPGFITGETGLGQTYYFDNSAVWTRAASPGTTGTSSPSLPTALGQTGNVDGTVLWECAGVDFSTLASGALAFRVIGRGRNQGTLSVAAPTTLTLEQASYELVVVTTPGALDVSAAIIAGYEGRFLNASNGLVTLTGGASITPSQLLEVYSDGMAIRFHRDLVSPVLGGAETLAAGISPTISTNITKATTFSVTRRAKNASTALGMLDIDNADVTLGYPGSFVVRSLRSSTLAVETGDASSFDWHTHERLLSPAELDSSLVFWLRADKGTTPSSPSNGANITAWADQSGAGVIASLANTGSYPTFTTSGLGGRNDLNFASAAVLYESSGVRLATTAITMFALIRTSSIPTLDAPIFAKWYNQYGYLLSIEASTGKAKCIVSNGVAAKSDIAINDDQAHVLIATADTASGVTTLYVDGIAQTSTGTMPATIPNQANDANAVGCAMQTNGVGSNNFTGHVEEVGVYNTNIGASDVSLLWGYLRNIAGI